MGKTKKKPHENRTRQVQLLLPESLIDAVKDQAKTDAVKNKAKQNMSFNEAGNRAIERYIETKGEDKQVVPTKRSMFLLTPSLYDRLSEMAEKQDITVTEAITHALEEYVIGEKRDNTEGWMITYAGTTASLRARVNLMGETVSNVCGGLKLTLKRTEEALDEKPLANKKEEQARLDRIRKDVASVYKEITEMVDTIHRYGQEEYDLPKSWTSEISKTSDSGT